jgi:hypothetical protein
MEKDKEKKKFKETAFGRFLLEKLPQAGDIVADILPDKGALGIIKNILDKTPDMDPVVKAEIERQLREHEAELLRIEAQDRADARRMNSEIQTSASASRLSKIAAYIIDFSIVGATIILLSLLFFKKIPSENKEIAYLAAGSLLTLCGTIINFHRGTSQGSSQKNEIIKKLSK